MGSQPGPMEELAKYFYRPDLQTLAGMCLVVLFWFMTDLCSSKELAHCISVVDLISISITLMHLLKFEF